MTFIYEGQQQTIKGLENRGMLFIGSSKMQKLLGKNSQVVATQLIWSQPEIDLKMLQTIEVNLGLEWGELQLLLDQFEDIFQEEGLPPTRSHDHKIVLKEGTQPINLRPHRYNSMQKDIIETMISEMLEAGII